MGFTFSSLGEFWGKYKRRKSWKKKRTWSGWQFSVCGRTARRCSCAQRKGWKNSIGIYCKSSYLSPFKIDKLLELPEHNNCGTPRRQPPSRQRKNLKSMFMGMSEKLDIRKASVRIRKHTHHSGFRARPRLKEMIFKYWTSPRILCLHVIYRECLVFPLINIVNIISKPADLPTVPLVLFHWILH